MIKVNLAKSTRKGNKQSASGGIKPSEAQAILDSAGSVDSQIKRNLAVRLVMLLIGPMLLWLIQDMTIPEKQKAYLKINNDFNEVIKKNQDAAAAVGEIKKFERDEEKLKNQISAVNSIRKQRGREVRVMDYIQREIPSKLWLEKLDVTDSKMQISGFAMADSDLAAFMESLQRSAYLKDVNLVRSSEGTYSDLGTVKRFEITCNLERFQ